MLGKLASLFLIAIAAYGQELPPTTLSVVVTDSKGNRVHTLTRSDFQVAKAEVTDLTDSPKTARRVVVLFDTTSIALSSRNTIINALRDFLAKSLRPGDR